MLEYADVDFSGLLHLLVPNNRQLLELTTEFRTIVESKNPETTVFCFYEEEKIDWTKWIESMRTKMDKEGVLPIPKWDVSAFKKQVGDSLLTFGPS